MFRYHSPYVGDASGHVLGWNSFHVCGCHDGVAVGSWLLDTVHK